MSTKTEKQKELERQEWNSEKMKAIIRRDAERNPGAVLNAMKYTPEKIGYEYWSEEFKEEVWDLSIDAVMRIKIH